MSRRVRFDGADNALSTEEIIDDIPAEEVTDNSTPEEKVTELVVTGCQRLNVRKKPSIDAPVILEITAGTRLIQLANGTTAGWTEVKTSVGEIKTGYVMNQFVEEILDG